MKVNKMKETRRIIGLSAAALGLAGAVMFTAPIVYAAPPDWNQCTDPSDDIGCLNEKVRTLSDLQPGLGTVMIEYGDRMTNTYFAAKGGNWGLAAYMVKEAKEIQEVGEATRPQFAGALKYFEENILVLIDDAIVAQDFDQFKTAFGQVVEGCNNCHASQGYPFIQYRRPFKAEAPLMMHLP